MKPVILVTNDDGYNSALIQVLIEVLSHHFDVRVVAPKHEKSWIGKAITRKQRVEVIPLEDTKCPTWLVDGTPADCVNIALGNILKDEDVKAVVSGINIGFNVSLPIILSSGTVGAALEGALMGYPAVSLSQVLGQDFFEVMQEQQSHLPKEIESTVREASIRAVGFVQKAIESAEDHKGSVVVHNFNFPMGVTSETPVDECVVAHRKGASIFAPEEDGKFYSFQYSEGENIHSDKKTDLNCLELGHISYSLLDYSQIS